MKKKNALFVLDNASYHKTKEIIKKFKEYKLKVIVSENIKNNIPSFYLQEYKKYTKYEKDLLENINLEELYYQLLNKNKND